MGSTYKFIVEKRRKKQVSGHFKDLGKSRVEGSCDANSLFVTESVYEYDSNNRKKTWGAVFILALQNISKGDEITVCYFWDVDKNEEEECHCASFTCTGVFGKPSLQFMIKLQSFRTWEVQQQNIPLLEKILQEAEEFIDEE